MLEGEAVATNKEGLSLKSYKAGDYFGEIALLKNMPRAANVSAKSTELRVLGLERSCFKRLLGPLEDILKRNMDNYFTMLWEIDITITFILKIKSKINNWSFCSEYIFIELIHDVFDVELKLSKLWLCQFICGLLCVEEVNPFL